MKKTVKDYIRTIADFPHEGILFRAVTTLFADVRGFRMAIDQLVHPYAGMRIDKVVGLKARGFIIGGAIAHQLSVGFVPVRKKGRLPGAVIGRAYTLEYGEAVMEIHDDALRAGERVLIVDDLLATGGTAEAGIRLVERLGAEVIGCAFIIELPAPGGRNRLEGLGMTPMCCAISTGHEVTPQAQKGAPPPARSGRPPGYFGHGEAGAEGMPGGPLQPSTAPGFMMPRGSSAALIDRIIASSTGSA